MTGWNSHWQSLIVKSIAIDSSPGILLQLKLNSMIKWEMLFSQ